MSFSRFGAPANTSGPRLVNVAQNVVSPFSGRLNSTTTAFMSRNRHRISRPAHLQRLAFCGYSVISNAETPTTGGFTLTASIEYPAGTFHQITFNGSPSVVIAAGATVWSDPVGITTATDDEFIWVRSYMTCSAGVLLPQTSPCWSPIGEGYEFNSTDKTMSGTVAAADGNGYTASAITGYVTTQAPTAQSVVIVGDSIAVGLLDAGSGAGGDASAPYDPVKGYIYRALNVAGGVPLLGMGQGGQRADQWANGLARRRQMLGATGTVAIAALGGNDAYNGDSFATCQASMLNVWRRLAAMGLRIYACTITPRTTSTDSWATVGSQTVTNSAQNSVRVQLNDWIRTTPAPLTGFFEVADTVESARNSGLWKAGALTGDGIHPSVSGNVVMQAAIPLALFR